jgi:ATP-dependent Lon protease
MPRSAGGRVTRPDYSCSEQPQSHLKSRDVKAVGKTVSGLVKLIYPNGQLSKEEVAEVELSLEGCRRVKEKLKKMGSFEFHQTSLSLIENERREEKFVVSLNREDGT